MQGWNDAEAALRPSRIRWLSNTTACYVRELLNWLWFAAGCRVRDVVMSCGRRPLVLLTLLLLLLLLPAKFGDSQHLPQKRYFFGNPTEEPCQPDEINVTLKGVPGIFCSPPCSPSKVCPSLDNTTLAPPNVNHPAPPKQFQEFVVKAACAIELKGQTQSTHCAMVCDPASIMPRKGCPGHPLFPALDASCQKVETIGICTYSTTPGPPPPSPGDNFAVLRAQ